MTIKAPDFDKVVEVLGFETRESGDLLAWFRHEGKIVLRTRRSKGKGGDLPFQHQIRQQMKLSEEQLRAVLAGNFTRADYIALLREKGLLDD